MLSFSSYSSLLSSADVCHRHRDQVDTCYAEEASKYPLTVPGLMIAPLSNIEAPKRKAQ